MKRKNPKASKAAKHEHSEHGKHNNPIDLEAYLKRLESPERAEWQRPDAVIKALGLKRGQTVAEIGAGPGYFSLRLAKAVGPRGTVFAVEVEPQIIGVLRERIVAAEARNVVPVLGLDDDPLLPPKSCDLVLMVNALHHVEERRAYLKRLARSLKPEGRLVVVDFHKRDTPVGPGLGHRLAREEAVRDARAARFELASESELLEYQYFLVLKPRA
ncbi:MAG TPA: SAM-dependent methyltransferase [Myxococcales bacterium]|nr:SAM-dependent methyltransferase [Myxococcales bacterium]